MKDKFSQKIKKIFQSLKILSTKSFISKKFHIFIEYNSIISFFKFQVYQNLKIIIPTPICFLKEKMKECLETSPYRYSTDPEVIKGILGCIGMKPNLPELKNTEKGGQYDMLCKGLQDLFQDGKNEGTISTLFSLMNHNIISLTQAAEQASVTEEKFMELVEQFHLKETQVS